MGLISWIVFGLIAGSIARFVFPGGNNGGWIITTLLGVAGAMVGGWLGTQLGIGSIDGFNIQSMCIAVTGALILLFVYCKVFNK
jgi:Predicted membrane protein